VLINPAEMEAKGLHNKLMLKSRLCEKRKIEIQKLKKRISILTSNKGDIKDLSLKLANCAFENTEIREDLHDSQRLEHEHEVKIKKLESKVRQMHKKKEANLKKIEDQQEEINRLKEASLRQTAESEAQRRSMQSETMVFQQKLKATEIDNQKYKMKFNELSKSEMRSEELRNGQEEHLRHLESIINALKISLVDANEKIETQALVEVGFREKLQVQEAKLQGINEEHVATISNIRTELNEKVIRLDAENQQMSTQFTQSVREKLALNESLVRMRTDLEMLKQKADMEKANAKNILEKQRRKSKNTNQHFRNRLTEFQNQCKGLRQDLDECKVENINLQDSLAAERMCNQKTKSNLELEKRESETEKIAEINNLKIELENCRGIISEKKVSYSKLEQRNHELQSSMASLTTSLDSRGSALVKEREARSKIQESFEEKIEACLKAVQKAKKCIQMLEFEKEHLSTVNDALTAENQRLRHG